MSFHKDSFFYSFASVFGLIDDNATHPYIGDALYKNKRNSACELKTKAETNFIHSVGFIVQCVSYAKILNTLTAFSIAVEEL